jgi:predicted lactoylglutathione lyase
MIGGEDIFVMLLTRDKFKTFTPKEICNATKSTEVLVCLSCESRHKVNDMVRKALAAAEPLTINRKTMGSCMHMDFRTSTPHLGASLHGTERGKSELTTGARPGKVRLKRTR